MTAYAFPCGVKPELFESGKGRDVKAVRKALNICSGCPAWEACRRAGREGREWGIWGGETQPERFAALGITEADLLPPDCETEMAYRRHKDKGEECQPCQDAHNARQRAYAEAAAERRRQEAVQFEEVPGSRLDPFHAPLRPVCGTERGYRAHLKRSELQMRLHPDCTCREAHTEHRAGQRQEAKAA